MAAIGVVLGAILTIVAPALALTGHNGVGLALAAAGIAVAMGFTVAEVLKGRH